MENELKSCMGVKKLETYFALFIFLDFRTVCQTSKNIALFHFWFLEAIGLCIKKLCNE